MASTGLGLGLGSHTWRVEPHWLQVVERPLRLAKLTQRLIGTRLVQLSDLHIGLTVDDDYLLDVFGRVKDLSPEIVVYTGDFTTHHPDVFTQAQRLFAHLPLGTAGTLGILGNHDYGPGWSDPNYARKTATLAESVGVRILRNEVANAAGLWIWRSP